MARNEIEKIKKIWEERVPERIGAATQRDSAVLVPLLEKDGKLQVLFEIRADKLKTQPREICFPGGSIDPMTANGERETARDAAVRETMEELLVGRGQIEVMAPLDILIIPTGMMIYPFLGVLTEYEDTCSSDEVERVVTVPLDWFLTHEPELYHTKILTVPEDGFPFQLIPGGAEYKWRQGAYEVLFYRCGDVVIWGMTAKILHSFIELYKKDIQES